MQSGGRVVKNVTGYDLHKCSLARLHAGSHHPRISVPSAAEFAADSLPFPAMDAALISRFSMDELPFSNLELFDSPIFLIARGIPE